MHSCILCYCVASVMNIWLGAYMQHIVHLWAVSCIVCARNLCHVSKFTVVAQSQMLEDLRGLLQAAEEKWQASISELSAKHQKVNLICSCLTHKIGSGPYFYLFKLHCILFSISCAQILSCLWFTLASRKFRNATCWSNIGAKQGSRNHLFFTGKTISRFVSVWLIGLK